jgi:hypothetical protein
MQRLIDPARAAHVAGVSIEEIHRQIAAGHLHAEKGKIDFEDLRRLYPELTITSHNMVDFVTQIKDDAFIKAMRKNMGFEREDPVEGWRKSAQEALYFKDESERFRRMLIDLRGMLVDLEARVDQKNRVRAVIQWLDHKFKAR